MHVTTDLVWCNVCFVLCNLVRISIVLQKVQFICGDVNNCSCQVVFTPEISKKEVW